MSRGIRRVTSAAVGLVLGALIGSDVWLESVRVWWTQHAMTCSIVASLTVLAVTALIVDDIVARRRRRERTASVGIQGLILFAQVRRAHAAVLANDEEPAPWGDVPDQLWALAMMLPLASPSVLDDHDAFRYLRRVERVTGLMFQVFGAAAHGNPAADVRAEVAAEMGRLRAALKFTLERIPAADRPIYEALIGM